MRLQATPLAAIPATVRRDGTPPQAPAAPAGDAPAATPGRDRLATSRAVFEAAPEGAQGFRTVLRDLIDAFMPPASDEYARRVRRAEPQVAANRTAEQAALAGWSAADREAYGRVAKLVDALPLARLSLQILLLEGRLPGDRRSLDGRNLLAELGRLEAMPLLPAMDRDGAGKRLDRGYLMGGLLQEIAFPSCINQRGKKTCTAATAQIMVARHHPAEYVRLVAGLASPAGEVRLANGDVATRVPGTESWGACGRTASGRLFQAAMMEYGNQSATYDDAADVSDPAGARYSGLTNQQFGRVVQGVTGLESRAWYAGNGATADDLVAQIRTSLAAGLPVPTSLRWGVKGTDGKADGYHKVLVTALEGDRVRYLNPWGQEESMGLDAFRGRLEGLNLVHADWAWPRPSATSFAPPGRGPATPANCLVDVATGRRRCIGG